MSKAWREGRRYSNMKAMLRIPEFLARSALAAIAAGIVAAGALAQAFESFVKQILRAEFTLERSEGPSE